MRFLIEWVVDRSIGLIVYVDGLTVGLMVQLADQLMDRGNDQFDL